MAETQRKLAAAVLPLVLAAVLGLYVLGFFAVTAVKGLDNFVTEGWAWLIVSGAVTLVIGVLGLIGKNKLQALDPAPKQTQASIQETVAWAKTKAGKDS